MKFKQLKRHGNGRAVTLEKTLLEALDIDDDTILQLTTDGTSIKLTPVREEGYGKKFQERVKDVIARYGEALKQMPQE